MLSSFVYAELNPRPVISRPLEVHLSSPDPRFFDISTFERSVDL
jgi:hypothetical protein